MSTARISAAPDATGPAAEAKLGRVLLADDAAINREILRTFLEPAVDQIDEAADGFEALELFKRRRYDAVLLDIEMPGIDGYGTVREMRGWERQQGVARTLVVAITTSDFPEDEQRIIAAGADAYLAKPVQRQTLLAALQARPAGPAPGHPMANLLPKLFAYSSAMLDEIAAMDFDDAETLAKKLHELRGALATFGFEELAERLKQMQHAAKHGELRQTDVLDDLRDEIRRRAAGLPS